MSFRNCKAFAMIAAAMLFASCMMFVIPESSSASTADVGTVVIESDMNDDMPIEEIVLRYGAISAEKEHQESMGRTVVIKDHDPQREDPKEQKFIDDMRFMIGKDRFSVDDNHEEEPKNVMNGLMTNETPLSYKDAEPKEAPQSTDRYSNILNAMVFDPFVQTIPSAIPAPDNCTFGITETATVTEEDTSEAASEDVTETDEITDTEEETEVIGIDDTDEIDVEFVISALELAKDNGIDICSEQVSLDMFICKMMISVSYNELQSIDTQSKDNEDQEKTESDVTIEDEEEEPEPVVFDIFESFYYQSYTPVAGGSVTDTLCSGTDI